MTVALSVAQWTAGALDRFHILNPRPLPFNTKTTKVSSKMCATLLAALGYKEKHDFQCGKTKIFVKYEVQAKLEEAYEAKISRLIVALQTRFRMVHYRKLCV